MQDGVAVNTHTHTPELTLATAFMDTGKVCRSDDKIQSRWIWELQLRWGWANLLIQIKYVDNINENETFFVKCIFLFDIRLYHLHWEGLFSGSNIDFQI